MFLNLSLSLKSILHMYIIIYICLWLLVEDVQRKKNIFGLFNSKLSFTRAFLNKRARGNTVLQVDQENALKQILEPEENATIFLFTPS